MRNDLSRPLRLAIKDGLLKSDLSFLDYGCGRGDDVARLRAAGFDCSGWDPVHAPHGERRPAKVVNLGYVINVIETVGERQDTLRRAWALATGLLVVSARLVDERPAKSLPEFGDGIVTRLGTFQKFYEQQELKAWIDETLGEQSVAAAPGVFYLFRKPEDRAEFIAKRYRRREPLPRLLLNEALVTRHQELLKALGAFLGERGRLPADDEFAAHLDLLAPLGSLSRAYRLLLSASAPTAWDYVRAARSDDLLLYLALAKFDGRLAFGALPEAMRHDVKAFFGSYRNACLKADALLFSIGDQEKLDAAAASSPIGKLLPTALYIHRKAVAELALPLRLYEGCARAVLGSVDDATIIKLRRDEPKISYLSYPDFERVAHPALTEAVSVHLQTFRTRTRRYDHTLNPPVLHRKECFVAPDHPRRVLFARLTAAEERAGLYEEPSRIGTAKGWNEVLAAKGLAIRGHRIEHIDQSRR